MASPREIEEKFCYLGSKIGARWGTVDSDMTIYNNWMDFKERISAEQLWTRLKLIGIGEHLQDRRLQWFGHLERMGENA